MSGIEHLVLGFLVRPSLECERLADITGEERVSWWHGGERGDVQESGSLCFVAQHGISSVVDDGSWSSLSRSRQWILNTYISDGSPCGG